MSSRVSRMCTIVRAKGPVRACGVLGERFISYLIKARDNGEVFHTARARVANTNFFGPAQCHGIVGHGVSCGAVGGVGSAVAVVTVSFLCYACGNGGSCRLKCDLH